MTPELASAPQVVREDLPPSGKLVWMALADLDAATQQDLLEWTQLPRRTLVDALDRLDEEGLVTRDRVSRDQRQSVYRLKSGDDAG